MESIYRYSSWLQPIRDGLNPLYSQSTLFVLLLRCDLCYLPCSPPTLVLVYVERPWLRYGSVDSERAGASRTGTTATVVGSASRRKKYKRVGMSSRGRSSCRTGAGQFASICNSQTLNGSLKDGQSCFWLVVGHLVSCLVDSGEGAVSRELEV